MQSASRILLGLVGITVLSVLTACGSGSTTTPALIRLVNASTVDSTLEISLNETYNSSAVPPTPESAIASTYVSIPPGTYTESVFTAAGTGLSSFSENVGLGTGESYTTIAYNRGSGIYFATITDDLSIPPAGEATVDIANISPDVGQVDVYVLEQTGGVSIDSLSGLTATISSLSQVSQALVLNAGTYDIFITPAGSPSDIRLHLSGVVFASGQIATIALTSTQGGALLNGVVINQGGAATAVANTQARVRVFSALPVSADAAVEVSVTGATNVGSTTLAAGGNLPVVYAPTHTPYVPVNLTAGSSTQITGVTVNGVPVASGIPTTALTSGGDYTVLVYGTVAQPLVTVISDDNQLIANEPSVRVINAAITANGGVSVDVDGQLEGDNVAYGTGSAYQGVLHTNSPDSIFVVGAGYNETVSASLVAGQVYTIFVYDPTQPPIVYEDN